MHDKTEVGVLKERKRRVHGHCWWSHASLLAILAIGFSVQSSAQLRLVSIDRLPLPASGPGWTDPQFSPDGHVIFMASADFGSIWSYNPSTKELLERVVARNSGYGFSVSDDGQSLGYRRTDRDDATRRNSNTSVVLNLLDGTNTVVATGADAGIPVFIASQPAVMNAGMISSPVLAALPNTVTVMGIENTKIVLNRNGSKAILDPFGNGNYIWPSLSPDKTRIVAYDVDRGTFVCDLDGGHVVMLGRKDAPSWTRDGKWIVYMNDRDDGDRLLSSDLGCIAPDGSRSAIFANTPDILEMHPRCSPVEDKIVCDAPDGSIFVIQYEEAGQ